MVADNCLSIKRDLNNIEYDRQSRKRKFFYHVHDGFISAVSLLNDLMKILVGLGIFSCVISKDLGSRCYRKNCISYSADKYLLV